MAAVWCAADFASLSLVSSFISASFHFAHQWVPLSGLVSWTALQSNCLFLVWPALNLPFPVLGFELMYNTKQQQLLSFHSPHRKISCSQHAPFWQVIIEFVNRCCITGNLPAYSRCFSWKVILCLVEDTWVIIWNTVVDIYLVYLEVIMQISLHVRAWQSLLKNSTYSAHWVH